ncbi:uncharacterized protein LOC143145571 isoform X3 [Ptiloglossa arizonensis]
MELHKRLPPLIMPKLPPKPVPSTSPVRQKMGSPYEEELFVHLDWSSYYNDLQHWEEQCQLIPIPNIILPLRDCILTTYRNTKINFNNRENKPSKLQNLAYKNQHNMSIKEEFKKETSTNSKQKYNILVNLRKKNLINTSTTDPISNLSNNHIEKKQKDNVFSKEINNTDIQNEKLKQLDIVSNSKNAEESTFDIPQLPNGSKIFDFMINGVSEMPGPVEYKICGVLQPPLPNKKSWLNEKHAHYVISGAADEPPICPVTYEMTGIVNVTPTNSDERFFAILKLGDGANKIYPSGRENLSPKWQEWLQNADEEFREVEREANRMIKSIEAITRLVFPGPTCDNCCSCRQTRKSYLKAKEIKTPYFVIDTITEDQKKNKCIVGSMAMHSPAPTPPESTINLLEIIASDDVLKTNVLINGVTNEKGEMQYFISGVKEDMVHIPAQIVERPPPRPPRNVPECVCAIQQIFNKDLTPTVSHDHIPWTKQDGLCFGKKFRPDKSHAFSCKMYPGDKSCRRNPYIREINKLKRRAERTKQEALKNTSLQKNNMYSIANFQPCGDEHGMSICGGPWGALHTLTPKELAEQEKLQKEILRVPPCGVKPGRAVCEGPFGERIPIKKQQIELDEIPGEFDEEDLINEEEKEKEKSKEEVKEKTKKRHKECHMSPQSIVARTKVLEKKVKKFIPDPTYPGYDDPWNIFRTAPSEKNSETDFKKLLKLTSPKPSAIPIKSKTLVDGDEKVQQSLLQKVVLKSNTKRNIPKDSIRDSRKKSPDLKQENPSLQTSRKHISLKSRSHEKIAKQESKSVDSRDTQGAFSKSAGTRAKTKKMPDKVIRHNIVDDKTTDQKLLREKQSKDSQKKMNEKTVASKNIKKESKVATISVPTNKNMKLKSKQEKMSLFHLKTSKRFDTKLKQNKKIMLKKSNDNETRISKKIATHHNQLNINSKTRFENSRNIEINKRGNKITGIRKLNQKETRLMGSGKRKGSKQFNLRKSVKRDKKKDVQIIQDTDTDPKKQILNLKNILKSSELYFCDAKPVDLPEEPPRKCTLKSEDIEDTTVSVQVDKEMNVELPSKGPCGWRTKSEQQLPTKKTLLYLSEPDYLPETIPVRPGGKPCVCRENREKKKVLLYNIGGLIGEKKDDEESKKLLKKKKDEDNKKMQVIDGVIYHTPPPSPRRSDEYVPVYDLCEFPYDMCLTKRKHPSLKFFEKHSGLKNLVSKTLKHHVSCGCNEFIDTSGIQETEEKQRMKELNKTRKELIEAKSQKEQWNLALKDVELVDYFTRCRDSMPCWLKCAKFNKAGCKIPQRNLKIKRPVCECKYERKILEHKEEVMKWKKRRQKLKSIKKQPYMNIMNISKPVIVDTKLMISGVKRIPRKDEYIDDVKYCITGVAENHTELPSEPIVGGVQMATPIHTPEQSIEEVPCVCLHRHWSPTNIPPGPLPLPAKIVLAEKKQRQKATEEAYKQIHTPIEAYDAHDIHSCKQTCNSNSILKNDVSIENNGNVTSTYVQNSIADNHIETNIINPSKLTKQPFKNENNLVSNNTIIQEMLKKNKDIRNETDIQKSSYFSQKPEQQDKTMKLNTEDVETSSKKNNESSNNTMIDLMTVVQNELKKMAEEGFLFAKLPKCFLMPQLKYWLMYRNGINISNTDKKNSIHKSIMMWNILDVIKPFKIEPPPLKLTKVELGKLTFDQAEKIKEKIEKKKEIFYSQVRKERVLYAQSMWNTMDYGKFPSISFKKAYFTYMANKEADGHILKPWFPSEVREVIH